MAEKQTAANRLQKFTLQEAHERAKAEGIKTQTSYSDALWTADSLYEAAEKEATDQRDALRRTVVEKAAEIAETWSEAAPTFERAGLAGKFAADNSPAAITTTLLFSGNHLAELEAALARSAVLLEELETLVSGIGFSVLWLVKKATKQKAHDLAQEIAQTLNHAEKKRQVLLAFAEADYKRRLREADDKRNQGKQRAQIKYPPILAKIADRERSETALAADKHERDNDKLRNWNYEAIKKAEAHFKAKLAECAGRHDKILAEAEALFEKRKLDSRNARDTAWDALASDWRAGQERLGQIFNQLKGEGIENCPDWSSPLWQAPPPAEACLLGFASATSASTWLSYPAACPTTRIWSRRSRDA